MNINNLEKFRTKIKRGELAAGMVITLCDPAVSELAGDAGYDFTWIDMEHAPLSIETIHSHIMALRGTDTAPFVRVTWNEHGVIKPILDLAPAAVIIPMVNTVELAKAAVSACRYPPKGTRGCGVRRGVRYGATPFNDYLKSSESEPMVIVQIEHIDAVRNLDKILKVPGIDSICVGPCDLSGSMGKLNQLDDPEVNRVIDEVCVKTLKAGLILGSATGYAPQMFEKWRRRGLQWSAVAGDCSCIFTQSRQVIADIAGSGVER